jgi:hypothetical protein
MTAERRRAFDLQNTSSMLYRVGLDPASLAAAGCTPEQTDSIIAAMMVHVSTLGHMDLINEGTAALRSSRSPGRPGNDPRPSGRPPEARPGDPPRGQGPSRAVIQAQRALGDLLQAARNQALTGLPADQVAILNNIRDAEAWEVPAEYRAVQRTPDDWKALKGALAARHHATRRGVPLAPEAAAVLAAAESHPVYLVVRDSMNARRPAIEALWNQRLNSSQPAPIDTPR